MRRARGWARLLALAAIAAQASRAAGVVADPPVLYRPPLAPSETVASFSKDVAPGHDSFPEEREAEEIEARLRALGRSLVAEGAGVDHLSRLLAPGFRGGALRPSRPTLVTRQRGLEVERAEAIPPELVFDARGFAREWRGLLEGLDRVTVAEFLVTAIEVDRTQGTSRVEVRFDIVGAGPAAWRAQRTGTWRMDWRRDAAGWRVAAWTGLALVTSRAPEPVFTEVTAAALGATEAIRRQLGTPLDAWSARLDTVLGRDSNGHHGVSVGDADGDGRDDLYVAQPSGLPNRLLRARGDGSFADVTERAGLSVLDDTAQSLFADVDNDGDQDLVLATATRPLLFANDGTGRFAGVPDAFRFQRPLQGSLTSMAMADYDRDSFLDLYLCVYSYFYGAGEDKAGTPVPYHDARNGPPGVLFRNDGRGRFVETTQEAGLEAGNDRYHFAAAWADYDTDGWPDLLVANDFGTKNLYRNLGRQGGTVRFEDVAERAGLSDHGAGMSAAFLDYDNDGLLDVYTGNMWSASGRRVTAHPAFLEGAPAEVRALYRRHVRGNSLFRNTGQGRFEDVTLRARAEMGRWAWSSDSLDFDGDGWEDLYVANGMLTREEEGPDLEGFFWRQVVARSPLQPVKGTPYDDAWRAINQMLIRGSIAGHQRNVLLRNDGTGGFDDVSGAAGLDLDQDGRSFGVLDLDGDGDPDLAVMAARQAPQLRLFRNDFTSRGALLAVRLVGRDGNRDAIGARVRVETGRMKRVKTLQAGSGFLSQHSKELLFGLGASGEEARLTVEWPSGRTQTFTDVPLGHRLLLEEGGEPSAVPLAAPSRAEAVASAPAVEASPPPLATWLYEPFPAPEFSRRDGQGRVWSLQTLRGRPAVLLFWSAAAPPSRRALDALAKGQGALAEAGVGALAVALDPPEAETSALAAAGAVPVVVADREMALAYAVLNRHLFMNRQDLRLPTALLLDAEGRVVKAYRDGLDVEEVRRDARAIEANPAARLARALPFAGTLHSPPGLRNDLAYGRELLDQGLEKAAVAAFERAAAASPSASTLYRLGSLLAKTGQTGGARAAFERALVLQPDLAEAHNDLGALLAQGGDLPGAVTRFRAALAATPDYPDALNNLGYALLLGGRDEEAREAYEKALALQPDFPEALNNLGLLFGRTGDLGRAESHFRQALTRRPEYGEAANNLALVLVARGETDAALLLLRDFLESHPAYEGTYVTLAKVYLTRQESAEAREVLERLLRRNPGHALAREILAGI